VIRKMLVLAFGLTVLMAAPVAAQYGPPSTVVVAPTTTSTSPASTTVVATTTLPATSITAVVPTSVVQSSTTSSGELGVNANQGGGGVSGTRSGATLPRTGVDATNMIRLAGVLLVAGGALTLAATKRRRQRA
jgi:LPXTG-motif cell wall-anchored protein